MRILRTISTLFVAVVCSSSFANDVYIEQAGDSTDIDIIQRNGTNTLNDSTDAATISGDSITFSLTQDGNLNNADVEIENSATSSNVDIDVAGGSNETNVGIDGASSTTVDIDVTGDSNWVSVCGANDGATVAAAECSTGITDGSTSNTANITGDSNIVNIEASGASQTNSVTIGADTTDISDNNTVNISNDVTGADVIIDMDGQDNTVDVTVQ